MPDRLTIATASKSALDEKINMALECIGIPVVKLPSTNMNVQKYSVLAGDSMEFVNLFQSDANEGFFNYFL